MRESPPYIFQPAAQEKTGLESICHSVYCVLEKLSGVGWGQWVQAAGAYQVRKDFWECFVISAGRKTRHWMQEAVFRVPGAW